MYDSEFICTYKMMDTEEEQEHLYKIQLLQAFKLDEWDDDVINDSMVELFHLMKLDSNLDKILLHLSKVEALQGVISMTNECIDMKYANEVDANYTIKNTSNSEIDFDKKMVLFALLFQYEYFDLFHKCIYDFIHYWNITDKNMNALLTTF
jgi:hypothetical protein